MPETILKQGSILLVGGLDVSKPSEYLSSQSATKTQNFTTDRGLLVKRYGTASRGAVIGGTDVEIMGGREFTREGSKYNIRIGRDKVERYNVGTLAWVDITGTDLTGESDDLIDTAVPLLTGDAILCITNGIDPIRKWTATGDTSNLGGTPPVAKFIQEYATYLVCANIQGGVDIDQRVQWSDTANPEEWSAGNSGAVDLVEDGEAITGLSVFGNFLCVHKKSAIYLGALVSTSAIFRFDRKNTEIGTVANGSIVNLPTGEQIFLGVDGIHLFNGISAPLIQSPVNDEIRDMLNQEAATKAWGCLVIEEDEAWIGTPIGDQETGETVYRYNYKTAVLYKDIRPSVNVAWRASTSAGLTIDEMTAPMDSYSDRFDAGQLGGLAGEIHFGHTDGYTTVQSLSSNSDAGDSIPCEWQSKDFVSQEEGRLERWLELQMWAKGYGTLTVEFSTDEGATWNSAGTITLTDVFPLDSAPQMFYFDVVSSKFRLRFLNDTTTDTVEIKKFLLGYLNREMINA
jgi:hypothetical protein